MLKNLLNKFKPKNVMDDFTFFVVVNWVTRKTRGSVIHGKDLKLGSKDTFKIEDEDLDWDEYKMTKSDINDVKIKVDVVYKLDWDNSITIMDTQKSLNTGLRGLTDDLVIPEGYHRGGLVGECNLGFNGQCNLDFEGKLNRTQISFQIRFEGNGGYLSLKDTFEYLQCFFLSKK